MDLNSGIILGIIGAVLSGLSLIVAFVFNNRTKPKPVYSFHLSSFRGIKRPDIQILFKGSLVPNLHVLRYVLWNDGGRDIRKDDLPKGDAAPRIKISDNAKLLYATAYSTTGDDTGKLHELSLNELALEFDYLNKDDAVIGEIYFSTNDELSCSFLGSVKGSKIKKGCVENVYTFEIVYNFILCIVMSFMVFASLGFVFSAFINSKYVDGILLLLINCFFLFSALANAIYGFKALKDRIPPQYSTFLANGIYSEIGKSLDSRAFHYTPSRM